MALSKKTRLSKLRKLAEIEGYPSIDALLEASVTDAVSPAICTREGCDYMVEMEPDQDSGFCEACHLNTVVSALVLADII